MLFDQMSQSQLLSKLQDYSKSRLLQPWQNVVGKGRSAIVMALKTGMESYIMLLPLQLGCSNAFNHILISVSR